MDNNLFDLLDDEAQQRDTKRACIVAVARTKKQCGKFFAQAASEEDFMARLSLVTDKINDIVREACIEQNTPDLDLVHHVLASELAAVYGEVMRSDIKDENIDPTDEDAPDNMVEHELDNRKLVGKPEDFKGKESAHGFIDLGDSDSDAQDLAKPCSVCGANDHSAMGGHDWSNGRPNAHPAPRHPSDPMPDGSESPLERAMRDASVKTADMGDEIPSIPFHDEGQLQEDPAIAEWQNAVMSGETQLGFEEWILQDEGDGGMPEYAERSLGNEDRFGSVKTAVETGDTYSQETMEPITQDPKTLKDTLEPSPKMDKGNAGDELSNSQKPIDVPSVANPTEQQDVTQHADYTKTLDVPGVVKTVNADTPIQPEHNVAPGTETFKNKNQADPVTNVHTVNYVASKWKVIG